MFVYINHLSVWLSLLYDRKIFKHSNKAVCHFFVLNSSICFTVTKKREAVEIHSNLVGPILIKLCIIQYETRLERLGLYSLYCRRQRGDLIETYKILNGYYDINPTSFFTLSNTDTTRGHYRKLFKFRSRLLVRHNFFTNRVVNLWNSLPADVISAPTVALFKKNLDDLWRTTRYGHSQRPAA